MCHRCHRCHLLLHRHNDRMISICLSLYKNLFRLHHSTYRYFSKIKKTKQRQDNGEYEYKTLLGIREHHIVNYTFNIFRGLSHSNPSFNTLMKFKFM